MKYGILHYVFGLVLLGVLFGVLLRMKKSPNEPYTSPNPSAGASMRGSSMKAGGASMKAGGASMKAGGASMKAGGASMRGSSMKAPTKGTSFVQLKGPSIGNMKGASLIKKKKKDGNSGPKPIYTGSSFPLATLVKGSSLSSAVKGTSMGMSMPNLQGVSLQGGPASGASLTQLFGPSYASADGSSMISFEKDNGPSFYSLKLDTSTVCMESGDYTEEGGAAAIFRLKCVFQGIDSNANIVDVTSKQIKNRDAILNMNLVGSGYAPKPDGTPYDEESLTFSDNTTLRLSDSSIKWNNGVKDGKNIAVGTMTVKLEWPPGSEPDTFAFVAWLRIHMPYPAGTNPRVYQTTVYEFPFDNDGNPQPKVDCANASKPLQQITFVVPPIRSYTGPDIPLKNDVDNGPDTYILFPNESTVCYKKTMFDLKNPGNPLAHCELDLKLVLGGVDKNGATTSLTSKQVQNRSMKIHIQNIGSNGLFGDYPDEDKLIIIPNFLLLLGDPAIQWTDSQKDGNTICIGTMKIMIGLPTNGSGGYPENVWLRIHLNDKNKYQSARMYKYNDFNDHADSCTTNTKTFSNLQIKNQQIIAANIAALAAEHDKNAIQIAIKESEAKYGKGNYGYGYN